MVQTTRKAKIFKLLEEHKKLLVKDIAKQLKVSEVSIRSDLDQLELNGRIRRFHGGVQLIDSDIFGSRFLENKREKKSIAIKAIEYISQGETIFLDSGTTILTLAKKLVSFDNLRIVTNSFPVANCLSPYTGNQVLFIGGEYNYSDQCCQGPLTVESLKEVNASISFLGADAVDIKLGIQSSRLDRYEYVKKVLELSKFNVLLVDSTKFNKVGMVNIAKLDGFNVIITDKRIPKDILKQLHMNDIEVVIADQ